MKNFYKYTFCVLLVFLSCLTAWSHDFGLILDQNLGVGSMGRETEVDYTGILIPRFSTLLGDSGYLYASAGISVELKNEEWAFIPELLRTEFLWQFEPGLLTLGRMHYSDPLGFVAAGLFDGAQYSFDMNAGTLSLGAWYTGFLYKHRANISMSAGDINRLSTKLDYGNFFDTYFAPNRLLGAVEWEHPGIMEVNRLRLALIGQFDLSEDDIHTFYLVGNFIMPFNSFILNLGASLELMPISDEVKFAFALTAGAAFELPFRLENQLSITVNYSSGQYDDNPVAYLPVNTAYQGKILREKFSALAVISVEYETLIIDGFSLSASSSYFIRNDLYTPMRYGLEDGHFMGIEFFAQASWSLFSDLQLNLGAGIFLPNLGNAAPNADPLLRLELGVILSIH